MTRKLTPVEIQEHRKEFEALWGHANCQRDVYGYLSSTVALDWDKFIEDKLAKKYTPADAQEPKQ